MKATNVFFGIGIAAALFFLVLAGISTFYHEPKQDDFCQDIALNASGQCDYGLNPKYAMTGPNPDTCQKCDYQAFDKAMGEHKKGSAF